MLHFVDLNDSLVPSWHSLVAGGPPEGSPPPACPFAGSAAGAGHPWPAQRPSAFTLRGVHTVQIDVDTGDRQLVDLTSEAAAFCRGKGDGLLHVFAPHATAGVALMELGSGSEDDLAELLERVLPRDDRYRHRHGSPGHGADHLLPVLVSPSLSVPVQNGRMLLGTWQSIVLVDFNRDNPRRHVRLSLVC